MDIMRPCRNRFKRGFEGFQSSSYSLFAFHIPNRASAMMNTELITAP